tara:strand:- start:668 stop:3442 length:2775 start_codon:yes stop_codon:yes gene_type:complete
MESGPKQFESPQEEINFLRQQIAEKERALLDRAPEAPVEEIETVAKQEVFEYGTFTPNTVLAEDHQLSEAETAAHVEQVNLSDDPIEDIVSVALERGIHNALTIMEKSSTPFATDEVHRRLVEMIKQGVQVQNLKEDIPPWQVLHMTLFEVALPETHRKDEREHQVAELFGIMEQFYAGMQAVGFKKKNEHYVMEIASPEGSDHIVFYLAIPNDYIDLFQKQILSLYPDAVLTEQQHDYNIFVEGGSSHIAIGKLKKHPIYPLRPKESFDADPFAVLLNAFSKIEKEGGGAAVQFVIKSAPQKYLSQYEAIIKRVRGGMKTKEAIQRSSFGGELAVSVKEVFGAAMKPKKDEEHQLPTQEHDQEALEVFSEKVSSPMVETNIRIAVSAKTEMRALQILAEIEATFNQFEYTRGNHLKFTHLNGRPMQHAVKAFSFREFLPRQTIPLSLSELASLLHFPADGIDSSPEFKQSRAKTAAAPSEIPTEGTLLGINKHRGLEREIYVTKEDRLRHFYIIGQTGTGKTVLMKNMIIQDIEAGAGVCMIDPHGTDIEDVLSAVPSEREQDVIYFDPSRMDRAVGFNMLEYDQTKPEQKTFLVNELFSIFQKLYGGNPESMGPMFEQYFRNSTLLVMEHPESGNTLMDISRVMSDAKYRRFKLEHATNPVVVQFWREIATKAGGEASLENIVPYIVSKFDVFTANDYIRPIIGQQKSAFDFRDIMDNKKILLVNLSKGKLGEINANLIGMIMVGKILMAALSRVDDPTKSFPDFYLHMDEFQNVSTDSISAILSEARKYKLGLTVAHQFIAQLDEGIKDAVFGNVGSMAAFRVGPEDSQYLEHQFSPTFDASDLMNVPNWNTYLKVLANGTPTKPFSAATVPPREVDHSRVQRLIEESYQKYGRPRAEVEAEIIQRYQKEEPKADDPFAMI